MLDFLKFEVEKQVTKGRILVSPDFKTYPKSSDLMIRGGDFYACWDEENSIWTTSEDRVFEMIDRELRTYISEKENSKDWLGFTPIAITMDSSKNGQVAKWHNYCKYDLRDNYHILDQKLVFLNDKPNKKNYASKTLSYPLEPCSIDNYEHLMSVIYSPEEREKIEWAIGSIVTGDSTKLQKFLVLYGSAGTGKSTVLNIIQKLFDGYWSSFNAKALGNRNDNFSLEPLKNHPLVAIQHDGDLSRIEDNTVLNSLVSHEMMPMNEKKKSIYETRFKCFLFMGTNRPVKITDSKSGILRRLIDVTPSGEKLSIGEYRRCMKGIDFELGGIACHCRDIYLADPNKYDDYIPLGMMEASNDFFNFMLDSYMVFAEQDGVSLKTAWTMYKNYVEEAKVPYPMQQMVFKEELKAYFNEVLKRFVMPDGTRVWNYYSGFKKDKFVQENIPKKKKDADIPVVNSFMDFKEQHSVLDDIYADCPAQYATKNETPSKAWDSVKTRLKDLNTSKLHYVRVPGNHIVIDFDIPDENGNKSFDLNREAASKWPETYAELSKSGQGIHLHYIYTGNVNKLNRIYEDHIEIKVFPEDLKSTLRRKLTKCNNVPIRTIGSGLPLKGEKKNVIDFKGFENEEHLRASIWKNLNKKIVDSTHQSVSLIYKDLEQAYNSGMVYDVTDMRHFVEQFAASSKNQSSNCIKMVKEMHFRSEEKTLPVLMPDERSDEDIDINELLKTFVVFDIEVSPDKWAICWKKYGKNQPVLDVTNPSPDMIDNFVQNALVGFNCRKYDNHILYAGKLGMPPQGIFNKSVEMIQQRKGFYGGAYNISKTDVYDYVTKKQSLKKWEIELKQPHKEWPHKWDEPVSDEDWPEMISYCKNDVLATEAVIDARIGDLVARIMQVAICKKLHGIENVTINDTTNTLSTKIIFGNESHPQNDFNYRDLSKPVPYTQWESYREKFGYDYKFRIFDKDGLPTYEEYTGQELPSGYSILPFFPGYEFKNGKSTYLGEEIGEGGRVYSEPGMYKDVDAEDVTSMHPTSIIQEVLFGPEYTKRFKELYDARIAIKQKDFERASTMLGGVLKPYLNDERASDVAQALKIVINSVYGLTSASFDNPFRDIRNADNIVAKRGALFMTLLKREVQKRGYSVVHIKTDCIKVPNATKEIVDFIRKFGAEYGYSFETEHTFQKYVLVNDAVYIGKDGDEWVAVGAQFQVPYVYKSLFTHESITFDDMCETKQVTTTLYLDMNENLPDVKDLEKQVDKLEKNKKKYNGHLLRVIDDDISKLKEEIKKGHDYHFVGRIGLFCPIKPGCGGGILVREQDDKFNSVTGTKGYRWLESDMVKNLKMENCVDRSYYDNLVNDAIDAIAKYGDYEWFVS